MNDDDTLELERVVAGLPDRPGPPRPAEAAPVFVDASGRRQRRVRRAGRLLAVPAAGYVLLLVSSAMGGPTVNSPFLPLPGPPATSAPPSPVAAPPAPATTAPSGGTGGGSSDRPASTEHRSAAPAALVAAKPAAPHTAVPATTPAPAPTTAGPTTAPSHGHPVHTPHP
ncbi:hypothetical protein [Kitasatospora sp. MAA4]|uniref:hypothetical protein n=1 Tax=Kitasatospora sp. MAA4 TaxID=3035093 RepID=UPI002474CAE7|nr:hypothetical protein [Kitasatospora sp. MAA4]